MRNNVLKINRGTGNKHKKNKKQIENRRSIAMFFKRLKRKNKKPATQTKSKKTLLANKAKGKNITIVPPPVWSFINNPDETISVLSQLNEKIRCKTPIQLDISKCTQICPGVLLHIVALMRNLRQNGFEYSITGNLPKLDACRKYVQNSGFLSYVKSGMLSFDKNYFGLKTGRNNDGKIVAELLQFIRKSFKYDDNKNTQEEYDALAEMVANSTEHAYKNKSDISSEWLAIAYYSERRSEIDIAFLDTGVGIPATVKQNYLDKIKAISNFSLKPSDSALLKSSFKGDFRTKTGEKWRGRGLKDISKYATNSWVSKMFSFSGQAFCNLKTLEVSEPSKKITGTVYIWSIKKR
ncbi:hypothetical protein EOM81_10185 [bacterium]|nr:hypothetical protein [bacterium]